MLADKLAPGRYECVNPGTTTTIIALEDPCHCLTPSINSHASAILSVTQTFHFKTFVLVFFRKHVFTSSCV
jgi:hypothetical protein